MMPDAPSVMSSWVWRTAGWVMVHYLWVGAAIWAVICLMRELLRSARPQIRYLFAVGALFGLVAGMVVVAVIVARSNRAEMAVSAASGRQMLPEALGSSVAAALTSIVPVLPWIWIGGGSVLVGLVAAGLLGAERLRNECDIQVSGDLAARCQRLAQGMGLVRPVAVAVCERAPMPMLVGIVRPLILLPPAALNGWTVEQLEMVLLHELAHVRRWDNLVVVFERLGEALLFFHPAVWFVTGWIRREREFSCDEFVVNQTDRRCEYAHMLTELAAGQLTHSWALASSVGQVALSARIRHILNREEESMHMSRFVAACLVGCFALGWGLLIWRGAEAGRRIEVAESAPPQVIIEPAVVEVTGADGVEIVATEAADELPASFTSKPQVVAVADAAPAADTAPAVVAVDAVPRGGRAWGPEQAEGPPNTAGSGDIQTAWASQTPDAQAEWIICHYTEAVEPRAIVIYETYNPGAVTKVSVFDANDKEVEAWTGIDPTPRDQPRGISVIPINVKYKIRKIKVYVDSPAVPGWNEIDAVGVRDIAGDIAWAQKVDASSTYAMQEPPNAVARGKRSWGPEQAVGPPDTDGSGDFPTAWASQSEDNQPEWLLCKYAEAVEVKAIVIHETFNPGAVTKVTVFDANNKEVDAWTGVDPTPRNVPRGVSVIPIQIPFKIDKIKIYIDSAGVPGWNEIDAVGLRNAAGETQWAQKVEASSTYASQQAPVEPAPRVVVSAAEFQRLRGIEMEVKELRKEVDRLKKLEAEIQELKRLVKENRQP